MLTTTRINGLIVAMVFALSGCVQQALLIELNRDGSGRLLFRSLIETQAKKNDDGERLGDYLMTDAGRRRAESYAAELGTGVTLESIKIVSDKPGWHGVELIYNFDDIEQLTLAVDLTGLGNITDAPKDTPAPTEGQASLSDRVYRFEYVQGDINELAIQAVKPSRNVEPAPEADPFDDVGLSVPEASPQVQNPLLNGFILSAAAPSLATARISTAVRLPGPIADSNAPRQPSETSAFLLDMRFAEIVKSSKYPQMFTEKWDVATMLEEGVDGVDALTDEVVKIRFQ